MTLLAGEKLGAYRILERIGAGGMGEVYRGLDPRLGREVAIKVSAERFSERFEREARAVAALNHPNVCTLYDVGPNYLVLEMVEGESPKGPLPLNEALRIAKQIAAALGEAHEKGIVHRDLKPANIKIKADGTVKVLDFGLAKFSQTDSQPAMENSPTISMAATQAGVILGTAAYMSPEQARGKPVDKRADIWAFGVVLHELITGRKLFEGEDVSETLAKVIQSEPPWDGIPFQIQRLLKKCLEKDPRRRLRDIGDAWELLEPGRPPKAKTAGSPVWIGVAGVLLAALGVSLWAPWRTTKSEERPLVRLTVDLGADVSLPSSDSFGSVIISPDATRLAFLSGTPQRIFTRRLDQDPAQATELQGTEGATYPFFKPDGKWLGFKSQANGKLSKISVEGGAVLPLGEAQALGTPSWGDDGYIIVDDDKGLVRFPEDGGAATRITDLAKGEFVHALPQLLPGGKAILFAVHPDLLAANAPDKETVDLVTLADHKRKVLVQGGTAPHYLATGKGAGHLLYENRGTLFAIPFCLDILDVCGTAVPMVYEVAYQELIGVGTFGVSRTGTLVYLRGVGSTAAEFLPVTKVSLITPGSGGSSHSKPLVLKSGTYLQVRVAPDGKRVALGTIASRVPNLSVYDTLRDLEIQISSAGFDPVWMTNSQYILFATDTGIFWSPADASRPPQRLLEMKNPQIELSFNPTVKRLAYSEQDGNRIGPAHIWTVSLDEQNGQLKPGKPEVFLKDEAAGQPSFSPDGKWVAYTSQLGRPGPPGSRPASDVFVRPFPSPASGSARSLISNNGGNHPVWSPNNHDLLYQSGNQIMAVTYSVKNGEFLPEKPRVWLELPKAAGNSPGVFDWDLDPGGKSVAVITAEPASSKTFETEHEIIFVQNFYDELRRRVPLRK